jgi:hypothetical protein
MHTMLPPTQIVTPGISMHGVGATVGAGVTSGGGVGIGPGVGTGGGVGAGGGVGTGGGVGALGSVGRSGEGECPPGWGLPLPPDPPPPELGVSPESCPDFDADGSGLPLSKLGTELGSGPSLIGVEGPDGLRVGGST